MEKKEEEEEVTLSTLTEEMEDLAILMDAERLKRYRDEDWLYSARSVEEEIRTIQKSELTMLGKTSMHEAAQTSSPTPMQGSEVTNTIREKLAKVRKLKSRAPFHIQEPHEVPWEISDLSEQMDGLRFLSAVKEERKQPDDQVWLEAVRILGEEVASIQSEAKVLNKRYVDKLVEVLKLQRILTSRLSLPYGRMLPFRRRRPKLKTVNKLALALSDLVSIRDNFMNNPGRSKVALNNEKNDSCNLGWIDQVDAIWKEVASIEFEMKELKKRALKKLQRVHELKAGDLALRVRRKNALIGIDSKMEELRTWVLANDVGVIGITGPGGIGKTVLLRQIQTELPLMGFQVVIYVSMKKNTDMLDYLRKEIIQKLGHPYFRYSDWRTSDVSNALNTKKFALLLDNVPEKLDLQSIGIPIDHESPSRSKVIVAAQSTVVCHQMGAERLLVIEGLTEEQSWSLFQQNAWDGIDSIELEPEFEQLGRQLTAECGGVPLSLITVGRAMAAKKSVEEWMKATDALSEMKSHYAGTEGEAYLPLEFCLINLQNGMLRSLLLFCSLFPENSFIAEEKLIPYCIAEGLLGEYNHIDEARAKGREAIERLVSAYLLERGEESVRIHHEMIRDVALRYGDYGKSNVFDHLRSGPEEWSRASRVCLAKNRGRQLEELPEDPICLNLLTLLLQNNMIHRVPRGFFRMMPLLRVLDLSSTRISELPTEIGMLGNLRFLNLAYTPLRSLPIELGQLTKLSHLDLTRTVYLSAIPREAVSLLSSLQVLYMFECAYDDWIGEDSEDDDAEIVGWKLVGHAVGRPGHDEKNISHGGDDERGMGNWKLISYGGDDERGMGNWKLISYGGDDERGMGNWRLQRGHEGDEERGHEYQPSHGGDDERGLGKWMLEASSSKDDDDGGDDERGMGNWRLQRGHDEKRGHEYQPSHGGDDERGLGKWRLEASSSKDDDDDRRQVSFDDLECLGQLSDVRLTMRSASCLARFFRRPLLPRLARLLALDDCAGLISIHTSAFQNMERLRALHIQNCEDAKELIIGGDEIVEDRIPLGIEILILSELPRLRIILEGAPPCKVFQNLLYVSISGCPELKDVSWVMQLPRLEELTLSECKEIEQIASDGEEATSELAVFPSLKRFTLINLSKLKFICKQTLVFPSLEFLLVCKCDELNKLPLGEDSAINLKEIRGDSSWWDYLQWEDDSTEYAFAHVFVPGSEFELTGPLVRGSAITKRI